MSEVQDPRFAGVAVGVATTATQFAWDRPFSANDSVVIQVGTDSRTDAVDAAGVAKNQPGAHVSCLRVAGNDERQA